LLNGAGNLQFVFNLLELVLGFGFAKSGLDMRSDFGRHSGGQRARDQKNKREVLHSRLGHRETTRSWAEVPTCHVSSRQVSEC
jgi:hypothetical protein